MVNKDRLTKTRRSWNMSRIRGKETTSELVVRRLLRKLGWHPLVVWECETKKPQHLAKLIRRLPLVTCERR